MEKKWKRNKNEDTKCARGALRFAWRCSCAVAVDSCDSAHRKQEESSDKNCCQFYFLPPLHTGERLRSGDCVQWNEEHRGSTNSCYSLKQVWHMSFTFMNLQSSAYASVSQVVPRPPVRVQRWEAPAGPRRAWHFPGPRVHVQTRRLCPVGLDQWDEQNWNQEGFSHQDNVSGVNPIPSPLIGCFSSSFLLCVTTPVVHNSAITYTNVLFLASVALFLLLSLRLTAWWNTNSFC